jgi:hypothetical protein
MKRRSRSSKRWMPIEIDLTLSDVMKDLTAGVAR